MVQNSGKGSELRKIRVFKAGIVADKDRHLGTGWAMHAHTFYGPEQVRACGYAIQDRAGHEPSLPRDHFSPYWSIRGVTPHRPIPASSDRAHAAKLCHGFAPWALTALRGPRAPVGYVGSLPRRARFYAMDSQLRQHLRQDLA